MRKNILVILIVLVLPSLVFAQGGDSHASQLAIDSLWIMIAAALVFLMQAGFLALEVGMVREQSITSVGLKNLMDFSVGALVFIIIGFGIMFGDSLEGYIGSDMWFLSGLDNPNNPYGYTFFLFQVGFATAAITIVSGSLAGRVGFIAYMVMAMCVGGIIYPVFGHWVWGNALNPETEPFLAKLGFMDFAGGTVVHSVGGWIALIGAYILGPRLGRFSPANEKKFKPNNIAYSVLGVMILWFGWYGFNGGSTLIYDGSVDDIILNTSVAAAAAALSAFFHCFWFQKKRGIYEKFLGGLLGGLVAITSSANVVSLEAALLIGLIAGVVHNLAFDLIANKLKIDDPVGAIPVHGVCGALGAILLGVFASETSFDMPRLNLIGVQVLGVVVCFAWCIGTGYVMFSLLKKFVGLRVSPQEENQGKSIPGTLEEEESEETMSDDDLKALFGDK